MLALPAGMPEPPLPQREVSFSRDPVSSITMPVGGLRIVRFTIWKVLKKAANRIDKDRSLCPAIFWCEGCPARISGIPLLITNPAQFRAQLGKKYRRRAEVYVSWERAGRNGNRYGDQFSGSLWRRHTSRRRHWPRSNQTSKIGRSWVSNSSN